MTMSYKEIQKELFSVDREIRKCHKDISNLKDNIEHHSEMMSGMSHSFTKMKSDEEVEALSKAISDATYNKSIDINKYTSRLQEIRAEKEEMINKISYQNILNEMKTNDKVFEQVNEISDRLYNKLNMRFGERLVNQINSNTSEIQFPLNVKGLNRSLKRLKYLDRKISKKDRKKDSKLVTMVDNVMTENLGSYLGDKDRNVHLTVYGLGTFVTLIAWKIASVPVMAYSVFTGVNNINNGNIAYEALLELSRVEQNLDKMTELQERKAKAKVNKEKNAIQGKYDKKIKECEKRILKLNKEVELLADETRKSFVFDDTDIKKKFDTQKENSEATVNDFQKALIVAGKRIEELGERRVELMKMLENSAELLQKEYLDPNKVGGSMQCISDILIDMKDGEPTFYKFPKSSSLYIYRDFTDVVQFVRLFIMQIRTRMSPEIYNIEVFDIRNLGAVLRDLATAEMELIPIFETEDDVKEAMDDNSVGIRTRISKIKANYVDVYEYNDYLLSIDSIAEPYRFYFYLDIKPSAFDRSDADLGKLSHESGIYSLVFNSIEDMSELSDGGVDFIDKFENTFIIERGNVIPKAKNYLVNQVLSASKNQVS